MKIKTGDNVILLTGKYEEKKDETDPLEHDLQLEKKVLSLICHSLCAMDTVSKRFRRPFRRKCLARLRP